MESNEETGKDASAVQSTKTRFSSGDVVATPGAIAAVDSTEMAFALSRHLQGDWGEFDAEDKVANDRALLHGGRLVSVYRTTAGTKYWIITEADRSSTTILLPSEY